MQRVKKAIWTIRNEIVEEKEKQIKNKQKYKSCPFLFSDCKT